MNLHRRLVAAQVAAVVGSCIVGFAAFHDRYQRFEAASASWLVNALTGESRTFTNGTPSIAVIPYHSRPFRAVVTPSCSALAAIIAVGCIASVLGPAAGRRRLAAGVAAMGTVAVGNIVRIAASVAMGLYGGKATLVLFHDWVGGAFTFLYTIGGYILLLSLALPTKAERESARRSTTTTTEELQRAGT